MTVNQKSKHRFVRELESFLVSCRDVRDAGWPRIRRTGTTSAPRVLIAGNIVLDLPVLLRMTLENFQAILARGAEKLRGEWELATPVVGGFVGHAAPVAADCGLDVHLCSTVAVPTPAPIRQFLESGRYDTRRVRVLSGPSPAAVELRFSDGHHLLLPRRGVDVSAAVDPPSEFDLGGFSAAVVNVGTGPERGANLARLAQAVDDSGATVGIVGRDDWTAFDLATLAGTKCWVFFSRHEAQTVADVDDPFEATRRIKLCLGRGPRLVVTLDREGACLLNGRPDLLQLPTLAVDSSCSTGAGDTLAVYATLASSAGMDDESAARLAVQAATKRIAGLPLPYIAGIENSKCLKRQ